MDYYPFIRPLVFCLPAEHAHKAAIIALSAGLVPPLPTPSKPVEIGNLTCVNPVGLAAGFDKNGTCVGALFQQGFGFVECGTVTPRPQDGNPKPRMFRLEEDHAVINRLGFNNKGLEALKTNLHTQQRDIELARENGQKLGINIGKNKDSEDAITDYVTMLEGVADLADYITINISSPNTPGLRDLQHSDALKSLLDALCNARSRLHSDVPLWLKLAPDLDDAACSETAEIVKQFPINALVIGNTTLSRPHTLSSPHKVEQGGLSGAPLKELSTDRLRLFKQLMGNTIPLIGVGGIASKADANEKFSAGATAIQLYSGLVYRGFGLVGEINT